jgi:arylsulfatase A-like enzyme
MPRPLFSSLVGVAFSILALLGAQTSAVAEVNTNARPNILFVLVDDLGWKDCSYAGSDFYQTPNIDRLAASGIQFSNAYSAAANCAPARASLMTGLYSPRHEIFNVGTRPRGKAAYRRLLHIAGTSTLAPNLPTWASVLKQSGYTTATMGKWHLSDDPLDYGFDVNVGGTHAGGPPNGYYPPHKKVPGLDAAPKDEYLTDRLSDEACRFIQSNASRPWCLLLSHFAVHTPIQAKRELVSKYNQLPPGELHNNVDMATMIESVDTGLGKIVDLLDALEQTENTAIVFYSDNGGYGPATDMAPLKGYKGTYYEGGIRVPLAISWPRTIAAGQFSSAPVHGIDFFQTLCEIASVPTDQIPTTDGQSILPKCDSSWTSDQERSLFWHFPAYLQSYRNTIDEQSDPLFRSRPCSVIRNGDWKLIHYYENDAYELYNLSTDVGETVNRFQTEPTVAARLQASLATWLSETQAKLPTVSNPKFDAVQEAAARADATAKSAARAKIPARAVDPATQEEK